LARNADTSLLASRYPLADGCADQSISLLLETETVNQSLDPATLFILQNRSGPLAIYSGGRDIVSLPGEWKTSCKVKSLSDSQAAHEDVLLFDERRELLIVWSRHAELIDEHGAFGSRDTTCEDIEESRLSAARGSHESQYLALI
jgi:hypothetical protein